MFHRLRGSLKSVSFQRKLTVKTESNVSVPGKTSHTGRSRIICPSSSRDDNHLSKEENMSEKKNEEKTAGD